MKIVRIVCAGFFLAASSTSVAGVYTDDLSRCLVESSTSEDKLTLVKWMFTAMALHPAVKSMAPVTENQRDIANKNVADLLSKLLTETCVVQSRKAIKYEGTFAIQSSFQILGQVAAQELFSNPNVAAGMGGLERHIDSKRIQEVLGITE